MGQHDVVTLNANFTAWQADRGSGMLAVEPFLYYAVEQMTKRFNLTDDEVRYGITDHSNDGGIDALYCLAGKGNTLIRDDIDSKLGSADTIRILVFQVKSSLSETGFKPEDIDKFAFFADDLLNMTQPLKTIAAKYEAHLTTIMSAFKDRYLEVAHNFPRLLLEFYYVTRGDGATLNVAAEASVERLRQVVIKHRGAVTEDEFCFYPIDTEKLLEFVRSRRQRSRSLRWSQQPMPVGDGYVGMVQLASYHQFLADDKGNLDELIFESNVRGNQGRTSVNRQMRETLDQGGPPDFWQMNNGITVTCSKIEAVDAFNLRVHDAQVVNGLQTSRQIFGYESDKSAGSPDNRSVLIKLIPVTDDALRDRIIRATNNQNSMKASALRATDTKQRDIEDLFKQYDFFYDRRPGFYKDQGKPIIKIVSLNEVVQAVLAIILHRPDDARARPGDYVAEGKKGDEKYKMIFGSSRPARSIPLGAYLKCVLIVRSVDDFFEHDSELTPGDQRNLIFYVAFHAVCELAQNSAPTAEEVLRIESQLFTKSRLRNSLKVVAKAYEKLVATEDDNRDSVAKGSDLLAALKKSLVARFGAKAPEKSKTTTGRIKDVIQHNVVK